MATVTLPNTFVGGTTALASEVNANFDAIVNEVNGGLSAVNLANGAVTENKLATDAVTNVKVKSDAAIALSKLANLTVSRALVSDGTGEISAASVTDTELGYLDGVTSAIQTQINGKQDTVTGVSDTEIGYLDGVTSAIQTQIDNATTDVANNTSKLSQSIHVAFGTSIPTKVGGHANLDVAAWPGNSQYRITHSQGDTNFAVHTTVVSSENATGHNGPDLSNDESPVAHVYKTSTYVDVWWTSPTEGTNTTQHNFIQPDFYLTIFPY